MVIRSKLVITGASFRYGDQVKTIQRAVLLSSTSSVEIDTIEVVRAVIQPKTAISVFVSMLVI